MKKKLASLALAMVMVLTLAVPAFASVVSGGQMTTTLAGQYKDYTLKLTVKDGGKVLVNPYKIKFTPPGKDDPVDNQIVNVGTFITNSTDVALKVTAKITNALGGNVSLLDSASEVNTPTETVALKQNNGTADSPNWVAKQIDNPEYTGDGDTEHPAKIDAPEETYVPKAAFMVFQIMKASDNETEPSWAKPQDVTASTEGAVILTGANGDVTEAKDCLKMAAVEEGGDPNYVCFHLDGLLNVYPMKPNDATNPTDVEEDAWSAADTIGAGVILTFKPDVAVTTYSGS